MRELAEMNRLRLAHAVARRIVAASNKLGRKAQGMAMAWKNRCNRLLRQAVSEYEKRMQRVADLRRLKDAFEHGKLLTERFGLPSDMVPAAFKSLAKARGW